MTGRFVRFRRTHLPLWNFGRSPPWEVFMGPAAQRRFHKCCRESACPPGRPPLCLDSSSPWEAFSEDLGGISSPVLHALLCGVCTSRGAFFFVPTKSSPWEAFGGDSLHWKGPTSPSRGDLWPGPGSDCTPAESKPRVLGRSTTSHALSLRGGTWIPCYLKWTPVRLTLCIANGKVGPISPSHGDLRPGPSVNHTPVELKPGDLARSPTGHTLSLWGGTSIPHDLKWTPVRLPVPPSVHCQYGTWPVFSLLWGPVAGTQQWSHPSRIKAQGLGKVPLQSHFESEGWNVD